MTWVYKCDMDDITLSADTKEQLIEKVMQHVNKNHGGKMNHEQAVQSVEKTAKRAA